MEAGLIDAIGKLSIEVVAILTLAYIVYTQGKGHDKMSKSIDRLTNELSKGSDSHIHIKRKVDRIHDSLDTHHRWSKTAVKRLTKTP